MSMYRTEDVLKECSDEELITFDKLFRILCSHAKGMQLKIEKEQNRRKAEALKKT